MYTINLYLIKANDQYHVKRSGTKISVLRPIETLIGGKSIKHLLCAQGTLKLIDINFRFLHRRLATNSYLQKIGIRQDRKCNFCHNEKEDLFHIFWQCQKNKNVVAESCNMASVLSDSPKRQPTTHGNSFKS